MMFLCNRFENSNLCAFLVFPLLSLLQPTYAQNVDTLIDHGIDSYKTGNYVDAASFFIQVLEYHPENCKALSFLGSSYIQIGKHRNALEVYKTMERYCDKSNAYFGIAESFFGMGIRDSTYLYFNLVIDDDPRQWESIMNFFANQYDEPNLAPLDVVEYLYRFIPDDPHINRDLSRRYFENKRFVRSVYHYLRYLVLNVNQKL